MAFSLAALLPSGRGSPWGRARLSIVFDAVVWAAAAIRLDVLYPLVVVVRAPLRRLAFTRATLLSKVVASLRNRFFHSAGHATFTRFFTSRPIIALVGNGPRRGPLLFTVVFGGGGHRTAAAAA